MFNNSPTRPVNELITIWHQTPGEMAILFSSFWGATCHAMFNRKVAIVDGLIGAITGIISGFFFCLLGFKLIVVALNYCMDKPPVLDLKEWWSIGFVVAFFANFLLGGMQAYGESGGGKTIIQGLISMAASLLKKAAGGLDSLSNQKTPES